MGEHIHHHVHETIQPVIQKETIQPSVVHTTIPVHEVHQNEAKHHTASALPAMSMDDFKNSGGHLSGRDERRDEFQGEPKTVGSSLGGHGANGSTSLTHSEDRHAHNSNHGSHGIAGSNTHGSGASYDNGVRDGHSHGSGISGTTATHGTTGGSSISGNGAAAEHKKPSLMDKLNPMKDANGDGKAGFMK